MLLYLSKELCNIIRYITPLIWSSLKIYVVSSAITISIFLLYVLCLYHKDHFNTLNNVVFCKNKFNIILVILITLFTLFSTSHQNYHSKSFYDREAIKYDNKLSKRKNTLHYDRNMLMYFNRNKKYMRHKKHIRLYFVSDSLDNGNYHKDLSKHLINKSFINKNNVPQVFYLKYYKRTKNIILEPNSNYMFNLWSNYVVSFDSIIHSQNSSMFYLPDTKYRTIGSLRRLPYVIYRVGIMKNTPINSNSTGLHFHSYHVNDLQVSNFERLHLNNVPKIIYVSNNITAEHVKKSLRLNINKAKSTYYKKRMKYYRKKKSYFLTKGIAKYVDICNFQIFIKFLILLMLLKNLIYLHKGAYFIYKYTIMKSFYIRGNTYNIIDINSTNFGTSIIDDYIFKLIPLVIAVMSGMFAMYSKGETSSIFEALIQYTIPILSSIQFFRLCRNFMFKKNANKNVNNR